MLLFLILPYEFRSIEYHVFISHRYFIYSRIAGYQDPVILPFFKKALNLYFFFIFVYLGAGNLKG